MYFASNEHLWIILKVIHLVRDPRAIFASMMHEKQTWDPNSHFKEFCVLMQEDIAMGKSMPRSR